MKYLRKQNLNLNSILDDTVLQSFNGDIELNPTHRVVINGDVELNGNLDFPDGAAIPGPEVSNVMYVTMDGDDENSGLGEGPTQAKRTIKAAVDAAQEGTTIFIRSGEYYEYNPIRLPPKVSLIGDNLRRTIVRPLNGPESYDIIYVERTDEYTTITTATPHGRVVRDRVRIKCSVDTVTDYDVNIIEVPSETTFVIRQVGQNIAGQPATGTVKWAPDLFLVNNQSYLAGMVFKGLRAPAYCINIDDDAIVDTSPYVQNCSNINGPWMRNGEEWIPFVTKQPNLAGIMVAGPRPLLDNEIDPGQVHIYGIDIEGAGSGMLIDGDRYNAQSPIKSMVGDAFTQVSQGGIGFHVTNFGYMQLVSCFAVFQLKAFYTTRGGYLSISNSVIDFGVEGFVSDGYYPDPYANGRVSPNFYSTVGSVTINSDGDYFTEVPEITIEPPDPLIPGSRQATAIASIDPVLGKLNAIQVTDPGYGYDFVPQITITPDNGAIATVNLSKNLEIDLVELSAKPQVGSIMFIGDDPIGYYISGTNSANQPFRYDEQKCRRDVGIIVDAVTADMVFGSNFRSVYAGLAYLRSYSSKVTSLQKDQTIAALNQAKTESIALANTVDGKAAIASNFDTVINIIQTGLVVVPPLTMPVPAAAETGFPEAAAILQANKQFIQDEIVSWLANNYSFSYNEVKCSRDVGIILEAVLGDMVLGTNYLSRTAALAYIRSYSSTVTTQQQEQTIAGIEKAKDIALTLIDDEDSRQIITENFGTVVELIRTLDVTKLPDLTYANPNNTSTGIINAAAQLIANKEFIVNEVISYIDQYFVGFNYDSAIATKCERDVEYIVTAATYDAALGTNYNAITAGLSYTRANSAYVQDAQKPQTIRGIEKALEYSLGFSTDTIFESRFTSSVNEVIDVLKNGTTSADPINFPAPVGVDQNRIDSRNQLQVNREFIKKEISAWIDANFVGFTFDAAKCERDVGYILTAAAYDAAIGTNYNSVTAGLAYSRANSANVLNEQKIQTVAGINTARDLALDVTSNSTFESRFTQNIAETVDIINNGLASADALVYPTPTGAAQDLVDAKNQLRQNRAFLQAEIVAFVNNNNPPPDIDTSVCGRDTGYIVDAVCYDILYGGNSATIKAATAYFYGVNAVIDRAYDIQKTVEAYTHLKSVVRDVIKGIAVTPTVGNAVSQVTSGGVATDSEADTIDSLVDIINFAIENDGEVPATVQPSLSWTAAGLQTDHAAVIGEIETIKPAVSSYITVNFGGFVFDEAKCERDVGYIVTAAAYDAALSTNYNAITAGLAYTRANSSYVQNKQKIQTVAGINEANAQALTYTQNAGFESAFTAAINETVDILTNGLSNVDTINWTAPAGVTNDVDNAKNQLQQNKQFIIEEVVAYVNNNTPPVGYDQAKCARDVGYIVDAITYDILYGGNSATYRSADAYFVGVVSQLGAGEAAATIAAYEYMKDVVDFVVRGELIPLPQQTVVSQDNTSFVAATSAESLILANLIQIVVQVITDGDTSSLTNLTYPSISWTSAAVQADHSAVIGALSNIQTSVTAFITDNFGNFTYDSAKCERDVGYIVDALTYDILYNSNSATIRNADAYFVGAASQLGLYEQTVTVYAYNYLAQVVGNVVRGAPVAVSSGNILTQDTTTYGTATVTESTILENLLSIITTVISEGNLNSLPSLVYPDTSWASSAINIDKAEVLSNLSFVKNEVSSYINGQFSGFNYDSAKCARDTGYIVDALVFDLLYGGNSQTIQAANSYYVGSTIYIPGEQEQTNFAYKRIQDIVGYIIDADNTSWTKSPGNTVSQDITLPAGSSTATTTTESLIQIIRDVVSNGLAFAPTTVNPTYANGANYAFMNDERLAILSEKTTIQNSVIEFLNETYNGNFNYNEETCRRDIRYIIDSMCYDLTYGGDSQTRDAGLAYAEGSVILGEIEQTQAAYEYWKEISINILKNVLIIPSDGNLTPQDTSLPTGNPTDPNAPAAKVATLLQLIIDSIDHGPGFVPSLPTNPNYEDYSDPVLLPDRSSVLAGVDSIQDNVINFLNDTYGGTITVEVFPPVQAAIDGVSVKFHNVSTLSSGGTAIEYVGAGVTYNALPFFGGEPIPENERVETNNGKAFTVTSDQVGNYRIGQFFTVNALTGEVTINAENLNLQGLASIGPFRRNGIPVGVVLREVSDNPALIASTGIQDSNTVPTQYAVSTYVEGRYLNKVQSTTPQTVASDVAFLKDVEIRGGDLTTDQTTFNLLDANATVINAFGDAATLNIGNNNLAQIVSIGASSTENSTYNFAVGATASGNVKVVNIGTSGLAGSTTDVNIGSVQGGKTTINSSTVVGSAETQNLFNTVATTVNFAGAATDVQIGAATGTTNINNDLDVDGDAVVNGSLTVDVDATVTGDLAVNGGDITTESTTFNLVDTVAETVNFAGEATDVQIGADTGTTTVNNNLTVDLDATVTGDLTVNGDTNLGDATSDTTTVTGFTKVNMPDDIQTAFNIGQGTSTYVNIDTNNSLELITFGETPKVTFLNPLDASELNIAPTTFVGGVSVAKKLFVGTDLNVAGNATLGDSRLTDQHTVNGTLIVDTPDDTAVAFQVQENTQIYITADTTNDAEAVKIGTLPKLIVENTTDSTTKDTGALLVEGGVGIEKNLTVGVDLVVDRNAKVTNDLAVNGGDLTTTAATFNLLDNNAVTVNFAREATAINIGAQTGTVTVRNENVVIDGDLAVNGGDLTTNQTTFNLLSTNATTVNFANAATLLTASKDASAATDFEFGSSAVSGNTFKIRSTTNGIVNYTTDVTTGTVNAWQSVTGIVNIAKSGTVNIGNSTTASTTLTVGGLITGNTVKLGGVAGGTVNVTTDVVSGTANIFTGVTGTVNVGGNGSVVNIGTNAGDSVLEVRGASSGGVATVRTNAGVGTVDLFNTVATTVNAFGFATDIQIGSDTGTTNINNNLDVDGDVNIDGGDLTVSTTSFNLANTTATTVNAFGAATTVNIGAAGSAGTLTIRNDNVSLTGDLAVNGGDLTTTQTIFGLLDTTATTINFGGDATAISIGADSGTTSIKHDLDVVGDVNVQGGDFTTNQTTFNLLNNTATTVNFAGAGTAVNIGATTGTTTVKNALEVDGDVTIDGGDLISSTATFNLVNTTATTVNFAGAATDVQIGAATGTTNVNNNLVVDGDVEVKGGDITTDQTTFNLLNTTATTVNAFGAATSINVGALNGTTTVNNNLTVTGNLIVNGTTTTVNTEVLNVADNIITLNSDYIGSNPTEASGIEIERGTLTNAALLWDETNDAWVLDPASGVNYIIHHTGRDVALGTETSGNYIATITGTTDQVIVTGSGTETADVTLSLPQSINTTSSPTFTNLTLSGDLAVNGGDLTTNQSVFNLLNDNATTVNFAGAATTLEIGAATGTTNINNSLVVDSDVEIKGGDLSTDQTSFNLINTNATIVNFAGAATTVEIGSNTGTTNINNNLDVDGDVNIDGGDLTVSTATFNLINTTATTVNAFGAATDIQIGAATGTTNINNSLDVDGDATVNGSLTVDLNATVTGDLAVNGGDLTTTATTFNLVNTDATTVNFANAGTTINIGNATGNQTVSIGNASTGTSTYNLGTGVTGNGITKTLNVGTNGAAGSTTNVNIGSGAGGTTTINSGTVVGSLETQNVFNTVATTVNAFGAATEINVGATSGTLTLRNPTVVGTETTVNLWNTTATTVNAFGAATDIQIGAATGTTNINNDLDVDGDVNIDGGDLTVSTATFNLANANATTVNAFGDATAVNVAANATSASTLVYGPTISGNTFKLAGTTTGTVNYTTDVTSGTVNAWQSVTGTINLGKSGAINLGNSTNDSTIVTVGGAITDNILKIAGTAAGEVSITTDVSSGIANIFTSLTENSTLNIATGGASTVNIGGVASTVNISELTLTTDLEVQYGGTGVSSFTTNGVIYGNGAGALQVTAASNPGSNATTSYGILTTDVNNVPVWTDVIDGGTY